jgi:hypothetical protein
MDQWLSANLSFRKPIFFPRPAHVEFVVKKLALGQAIFEKSEFTLSLLFHLYCILIHLTQTFC